VNVLIDLDGDDDYVSSRPGVFGGAIAGYGVLVDARGDDEYYSGPIGLGAATFGAAALVDLEGDDRYQGEYQTMGAAVYGAALLHDGGGDDVYLANGFAQGFGGPFGAGALLDATGDDTYSALGRFTGRHRYPPTSISFAQGAAMGFRLVDLYNEGRGVTRASIKAQVPGGLGILVDVSGDDRYLGDLFAQGVGYWLGVGALVDRAGNDDYRAFWYAQGAAAHAAAGILYDESGDDRYGSDFTSQGVGHDLSVGWLIDGAGDDEYRAGRLAQGAATAPGGYGVLCDGGGRNRAYAALECQGAVQLQAAHPEWPSPAASFIDLGRTVSAGCGRGTPPEGRAGEMDR
jgi:hypothetical protein